MRKFFLFFFSFVVTCSCVLPVANAAKPVFKTTALSGGEVYADFDESEIAAEPYVQTSAAKKSEMVYVGGIPVGITLKNRGLIIIGKTDIITEFGLKSTINSSDVQNGDILITIENREINTTEELSKIINEEQFLGKKLNIVLLRNGKQIAATLEPQLDINSKKYKAGLWVREETLGIGTLTYIKESDKRFGALGHPVADPDTGEALAIIKGETSNCTITGFVKGERGKAGELKGVISKGEKTGTIDKNNTFGVFGNYSGTYVNPIYLNPVAIMPHKDIKPGKAKIITTIDGKTPKEYDIEIIKNFNQTKPSDKNLVIRITDKELLSKTGGIVQGMSGSPIIQNGKLCGAVTHVFINDPTKGYGIFADFMINN